MSFESVETIPGSHVEPGDNPGHKELGEREEVGEIDAVPNFGGHELRGVANENRKKKVVDQEEQEGRDDEDLLRGHEVPKLTAFRHTVPHRLAVLVRLDYIWHRYPLVSRDWSWFLPVERIVSEPCADYNECRRVVYNLGEPNGGQWKTRGL